MVVVVVVVVVVVTGMSAPTPKPLLAMPQGGGMFVLDRAAQPGRADAHACLLLESLISRCACKASGTAREQAGSGTLC